MCWSCGCVFWFAFSGTKIQPLGLKLLRNEIPSPWQSWKKMGMSVFLASADPFVFGSSAAVSSRSASQLSCLQFNVGILFFVRKTWKCYILITEGVTWGHFLPPLLAPLAFRRHSFSSSTEACAVTRLLFWGHYLDMSWKCSDLWLPLALR